MSIPQPPPGVPQHPQAGEPTWSTPPAHPPQAPAPRGDGFLRSLFDVRFEKFITIRFASVIYIIGIVVAALGYIGTVVSAIILAVAGSAASSYYGSSGMGPGGVMLILSAIFLGWIPAFVQIIVMRVVIEFVVANVRTAINTTHA